MTYEQWLEVAGCIWIASMIAYAVKTGVKAFWNQGNGKDGNN